MVALAKWLTHRIVIPACMGSIPICHPTFSLRVFFGSSLPAQIFQSFHLCLLCSPTLIVWSGVQNRIRLNFNQHIGGDQRFDFYHRSGGRKVDKRFVMGLAVLLPLRDICDKQPCANDC